MSALWAALLLGLALGAQHAFEPDHLAAVGTMLPEGSSLRRAAARGAWWGLGHGAAIAAVGVPLLLLGVQVPEALESLAELLVGLMLVGLGLRALGRARRPPGEAVVLRARPAQAVPVGLLHGLAGSGAAVVLATAKAQSLGLAVVFLLVFTLGATLSMTGTAALASLPLRRLVAAGGGRGLVALSGLLSVAVGLVWAGPGLAAWLSP